ncbi:hypothetical protein AAFF_G00167050 [Aldrovandia affinis]|uniref:Uncharacterized protein n=1 Tax=Aldrovandia affinis TaxID=143900 RepID=A0AAD7W762_9TELE|nr:hypothetical protein AAFF_G00167050 [Aldrovandia affinis]
MAPGTHCVTGSSLPRSLQCDVNLRLPPERTFTATENKRERAGATACPRAPIPRGKPGPPQRQGWCCGGFEITAVNRLRRPASSCTKEPGTKESHLTLRAPAQTSRYACGLSRTTAAPRRQSGSTSVLLTPLNGRE